MGATTSVREGMAIMAAVLPLSWPLAAMAAADGKAARGERIYSGREAVAARLEGHDQSLPAGLGKCASCHQSAGRSKLEADLAPPLAGSYLTQARPRRGGPPSAYDQASFCKAVRTGVDPRHVTLLRAMPRFDMNDEQCAALWYYLTEKKHERH